MPNPAGQRLGGEGSIVTAWYGAGCAAVSGDQFGSQVVRVEDFPIELQSDDNSVHSGR